MELLATLPRVTGLEVALGEAPVDAAGERRGRGGKVSPGQARTVRSGECERPASFTYLTDWCSTVLWHGQGCASWRR
jgi:hypothetical protein